MHKKWHIQGEKVWDPSSWQRLHQYIMSLRISPSLTHLAAELMTKSQSWSCTVSYLVTRLDSPLVYLIFCTHILIHLICLNFLFIKISNPNWPHGKQTNGLGVGADVLVGSPGTWLALRHPHTQKHTHTSCDSGGRPAIRRSVDARACTLRVVVSLSKRLNSKLLHMPRLCVGVCEWMLPIVTSRWHPCKGVITSVWVCERVEADL